MENWKKINDEEMMEIYGGAFDVGGFINSLIGVVEFSIIAIPTAKQLWSAEEAKITLPGGFSAEWSMSGEKPKEINNNVNYTPGYYYT